MASPKGFVAFSLIWVVVGAVVKGMVGFMAGAIPGFRYVLFMSANQNKQGPKLL